jgi:histidinol-phosphate aminotransferase
VEPLAGLPPGIARRALASVTPYQPGRPIDDVRRELGLERVVKLASNEGPHPPFPAAREAIARAAADQRLYPDPGCWALRDALSGRLGVPADALVVGNGVDALIKLLCLALLEEGDELAMGWPSFISWRGGAALMGATVRAAPLRDDGAYDLDALLALVGPATKLVVVVSPNNPTGGAVSAAGLAAFLDALPDHVLPVLDEAYFEYLPPGGHDGAALLRAGRRLAVTRTFSKAYGLAGLRVGYLAGPPELIRLLSAVRNAFDVNAVAQAAALASLAEADAELPPRMAENVRERGLVASGLRALGLDPLPSTANFLLVPLGSAARATALNDALLRRGIIVRPAGPFGAPDALRISIGLPGENAEMLVATAAALAEIGAPAAP